MSYQVIARKWRPKSFTELIGQDHVARTLLNALRSNRLPHALLFTGARGVGKTSSARILAKSLRCLSAKDFVPCNECQSCQEINSGSAIDVIEIDGASNNGVDAIRELRETVGFMPSYGSRKVYIIDEVHMLSTSAFNALLKTLEEPPAHVVFVLATTEPQKIPLTVLSRCQRFDFRRIPTRQIMDHLQKICTSEKIVAASEALWLVARQADGSMRDSQSLLDQVITFSQGEMTHEKVVEILGLTDRTLLRTAIEAIVYRDAARAMKVIENIFVAGCDSKLFTNDMLEEIRHMLLAKVNSSGFEKLVDLPDSEITFLKELAAQLSEEDIHLLFDMALKGAADLNRAPDPRLALEVLLLRMVHAPRIANLMSLLAGGVVANITGAAAGVASAVKRAPEKIAEKVVEKIVEAVPVKVAKPKISFQEGLSLTENWTNFVDQVKDRNALLGAKLEHASPLEILNDAMTIGFPKTQEFLYNQLSELQNKEQLTTLVREIWGKILKIEMKLVEKAAAPTVKQMSEKKEADDKEKIRREIEADPLVQATQKVFKTTISAIKEKSKE